MLHIQIGKYVKVSEYHLIIEPMNVNTVKPVTQPAGYTRFHGLEGRVKLEGGLYSRAGNRLKIV